MGVQVTEDEVDKRAREIRERRARGEVVDASTIRNADPGKRYKWVNRRSREAERVHHFQDAGYKTVKAPEKGEKGAHHVGRRKDETGHVINGDLVLMEADRDVYIDRLATNKNRARAAEQMQRDSYREEIDRIARDEGKIKRPVAFDDSKEGAERVVRRRVSAADDDD